MERTYPGTYWEIRTDPSVVEGSSSSIGAMLGPAKKGEWHRKRRITSYTVDFMDRYGGPYSSLANNQLAYSVKAFFENGGKVLDLIRVIGAGCLNAYGGINGPGQAANVFTGYAATPGAHGNSLGMGTAKYLGTVDAATSNITSATTSVVLSSVAKLEVGDAMVFVQGTNMFAGIIKTITTATKTVEFYGLFARAGSVSITSGTVIAGVASTHKAKTRLAAGITSGTAFTSLTLVSTSGITAGSVLVIVPADTAKTDTEMLVTRVEGNTVYCASPGVTPTATVATTDAHQVVSMEFDLKVYDEGALKETHTYLSMESTSADYIQTRLGWNTEFATPAPSALCVPHDQNQSKRLILKKNTGYTPTANGTPAMYLGAGIFDFTSIMDTFTAPDHATIQFTVTDGTVAIPNHNTVTLEASRARHVGDAAPGPTWLAVGAATVPFSYSVDGTVRTLNVPNTLNTQDLWLEWLNTRLIGCQAMLSTGGTVDFVGDHYGVGASVGVVDTVANPTHADVLARLDITVGVTTVAAGPTEDCTDMSAVTRLEIATVINADAGTIVASDITTAVKVVGATAGADQIIRLTDPAAFAGVSAILGGVSGTNYYGFGATLWPWLPIPSLKTSLSNGADGSAPGHGTGANTYIGSSTLPKTGIYLLDDVKDVAFWSIPGGYGASATTPTTSQGAIDYGDAREDMTFICGTPSSIRDPEAAANYRDNVLFRNSHETELAWPWRKQIDTDGITVVEVCAEGYVMAEFAVAAQNVGPAAAPANRFEERGPFDLVYNCNDTEHGLLNPIGVCVARKYPEGGIRHMGARTLWRQADGLHLVTVVNGLHWLRKEADKRMLSQLFVSGSINESTYTVVRNTFDNLCSILWNQGAFGKPKNEAYIIKCDDTTTSPEDKADLTVRLELTLNQFGLFMEKLVVGVLISPSGVSLSVN